MGWGRVLAGAEKDLLCMAENGGVVVDVAEGMGGGDGC